MGGGRSHSRGRDYDRGGEGVDIEKDGDGSPTSIVTTA